MIISWPLRCATKGRSAIGCAMPSSMSHRARIGTILALWGRVVPFTDAAQLDDVRLTTHVNGDFRQEDRTSRMIFPIRRQIEYISTLTTLMPGDIIVTDTPTGAGARLDPPIYLKPGDVVEVTAEGIGTLRNMIEDEI